MDNIPVCSNWSMLTHFGKEYERIMFMFRDDLIETTKCSLPCTFLEYKVIHHVIMPLFSILTQTNQLTDNRQLLIKCDYQNRSHSIFFQVIEKVKEPMHEIELWLSIASKSVEVLREELSYPFLSLVADIGGVLGLFIGFNFLMIWDGVLFCVRNKFSMKKHK